MKKQRWRFTKGYWAKCYYCGNKYFVFKGEEEENCGHISCELDMRGLSWSDFY
jgi:hypothetical protein